MSPVPTCWLRPKERRAGLRPDLAGRALDRCRRPPLGGTPDGRVRASGAPRIRHDCDSLGRLVAVLGGRQVLRIKEPTQKVQHGHVATEVLSGFTNLGSGWPRRSACCSRIGGAGRPIIETLSQGMYCGAKTAVASVPGTGRRTTPRATTWCWPCCCGAGGADVTAHAGALHHATGRTAPSQTVATAPAGRDLRARPVAAAARPPGLRSGLLRASRPGNRLQKEKMRSC